MNGLIAELSVKYVPDEMDCDWEDVVNNAQRELERQAKELGFEVSTHRKTGKPDAWVDGLGFGQTDYRSVGGAKRSLRHLGKDCATRDQSIIGFVYEEKGNNGRVYDFPASVYWVSVERI
tara:strand:- start:731 stop:1090 length:360 start_codon:yes stop_codon:yes gene_type:complete